ncbi:hypothetical protein KXD93_23340 [Mucilaginibacter sp. BJC16-A38]|uniref:hypothetical protein n=1 Tax=Mucilaginibacter phenanthrenivorans TaxID=1234842 RepID=UPI002157A47B|nr:hypothetical protein [Mucilaginibacter phenanthrenivorans]MCR8560609.1 hypothetical protein [Mucilaginibacter phenanthrenivorans]
MKKIILNLLAAAFIIAISSAETKAQVSVGLSVGVNTWTPPADYSDANYYYLPDVEGYYYVPTHQYVYMDGGRWVFRASLPPRYASYDIRTGYKVAVYRPHPYRYFSHDRVSYGRYTGHGGGGIMRDRYRARYAPHHDNGNHYGERQHGFDHNRGQFHGGGDHGHGGGRPQGGGDHGHGGGDRGHGGGGDHGGGGHGGEHGHH